jgi:hypothetical protein
MGMGHKDGVNRPDICAKHLLAKIGSAVDHDPQPAGLNEDRRAKPDVTRIS